MPAKKPAPLGLLFFPFLQKHIECYSSAFETGLHAMITGV
jgi:hypothetical protein